MSNIPISVLVTTKNEEKNIERCLLSLSDFAEVIVIDSHSTDRTVELAQKLGVNCTNFMWDGQYPKKRQWCLGTLKIKYNWVFWVDADEALSTEIIEEIRELFTKDVKQAGFFVKGQYIIGAKSLRYGLRNNKLALFDRTKIEFPRVDDLDIEGMGEIEGHYQPVLKVGYQNEIIGSLKQSLRHYAYDDQKAWSMRHEKYAKWEARMIVRNAYPNEPVRVRGFVKNLTRRSLFRPYMMFFYSYIYKLGFLDGRAGYAFAQSRKAYCDMVRTELKALS